MLVSTRSPDQRIALLVGVSSYPDDIPSLKVVEDDLDRLQGVLVKAGYEVTPLLNPTATQIEGHVYEFLTSERAKDATAVLFFSGHGMRHGGVDYLLPGDLVSLEQARRNPAKALASLDIRTAVEQSKAHTIVQFVDACRENLPDDAKAVLREFGADEGNPPDRRHVTIHGCAPGQFCYFHTDNTFHASLFAAALCKVLDPLHPASTIDEVRSATDEALQALVERLKPGRTQRVHVSFSDTIADEVLRREICPGSPYLWGDAVASAELWNRAEPEASPALRQEVEQIAAAAWSASQETEERLPDVWRDLRFPLRCLQQLDALLPPETKLRPGEVAALIAAPFLREAVLTRSAQWLAGANPLDVSPAEAVDPARAQLEAVHRAFPRIVERTRSSDEDPTALATWLLHRAMLRQVQFWEQPEALELSQGLARALDLADRATTTAERLQAIALHVAAVKEDLDRDPDTDRPPLEPSFETFAGNRSEAIRQQALAVLVAIAGQMAVDVRQLGDVVVNHIGEREQLSCDDVIEFLGEHVKWLQSNERATLRLIASCPHPALQLALEEQAAHVTELLDYAHRTARHSPEEIGALLADLPRSVSTDELEPVRDERGRPRYETPLLTFRLAHDEIRDLLMGVRLYGDPALAIRELYQNALDACRYRRARAQFADEEYHGRIDFRQGVEDGRLFIECEDNGVGMGVYELEHVFSRAGRRFVHTPEFLWEQAKWKEHMPELKLWPNSRFGIGVFSYFMLADQLEIWTARADRVSGWADTQELHVQITSSGTLFRIQKQPTGERRRHGGTLIRLYLRTSDADDDPVSCITTLRGLLCHSEFDVSCAEEDDLEQWRANQLHVVGTDDHRIVPGSDRVWFAEDGALLADGILTDVRSPGFFVNLTGEHQAVLSVDRQRVEGWDRACVDAAAQEAAAQVPLDGRLTFSWLWHLCRARPSLGQRVWETLRQRNAQLGLSGRWPEPRAVGETGGFGFDRSLVPASDPARVRRYDDGLSFVDHDRVAAARTRFLDDLWPTAELHHGPDLHMVDRQLPERSDWQPMLEPLDYLLVQKDDSERQVDEDGLELVHSTHSFAGRVAHASVLAGISVQDAIARFRRLAVFGAAIEADHVENDSVHAQRRDVALVDAAGSASDAHDLLGDLATVARAQRVTMRELAQRLERYRQAGLRLVDPDLERIGAIADRVPTALEASIMSMPLGEGDGTWAVHWLNVASHLWRSELEAWDAEAFEDVAGLLGIASEQRALMQRCLEDDCDLLALSRDLDRVAPWIQDRVEPDHVRKVAERLEESPGRVLERLGAYAAALELTLPSEAEVASPSSPPPPDRSIADQLGRQDKTLLSYDVDGSSPFHTKTELSVVHLILVSAELREPLGSLLERIKQLPPELGVTAPEVPARYHGWTGSYVHRLFFEDELHEYRGATFSPFDYSFAATTLQEPIGAIVRTMSELSGLLPGVPVVDPGAMAALDELRAERTDKYLLHLDAHLMGSPLLGPVPPLHLLHAGVRLGWTLGRVFDRLAAYAPLGLELPPVEPGAWREAVPSWEDFIVLSPKLDAADVLAPGPLDPTHVARAASALRCEPSHVRERLELYAGMLRLELAD